MGTRCFIILLLSCVVSVESQDDDPSGWKTIMGPKPWTSAMDSIVTLAANWGNDWGESLAQSHDVGISGSVINNSKFNFRLIKCDSISGAMSQYFPLVISPDTTNSDISGYGKKMNGVGTIHQQCLYAIYDVDEKIEPDGSHYFKEGKYNGEKSKTSRATHVEFGVHTDKNGENFVHLRFGSSKMTNNFDTAATANEKKTKTLRRCSPTQDLCVEATMGTGKNPTFQFEIIPVRPEDLTSKQCILNGGTVKDSGGRVGRCVLTGSEYCDVIFSSFEKDIPNPEEKKRLRKNCDDKYVPPQPKGQKKARRKS